MRTLKIGDKYTYRYTPWKDNIPQEPEIRTGKIADVYLCNDHSRFVIKVQPDNPEEKYYSKFYTRKGESVCIER